MRITSKGQVTIPQDIREKLGLLPETDVEFEIDGNTVRIRKARSAPGRRGDKLIAQLVDSYVLLDVITQDGSTGRR